MAARTERAAATKRSGSAHLGRRLRTVLIRPRDGFAAAFGSSALKQAADSPLPSFLVFLGGASIVLIWLKVSGLLRLRDLAADEFKWGVLGTVLLLGAFAATAGYVLWGRLGPRLSSQLSTEKARLTWAFANFPLALFFLVILPLDLLIVGPEIFATEKLPGDFARVWAAMSVALALAALSWWGFLMWRGVQVGGRVSGGKALAGLAVAAFCYPIAPTLLVVAIDLARGGA